MARGRPALVGALLGLPLVAAGGYVALAAPALPAPLGIALAAFGVVLLLVGGYIRGIAAPEPPALQADEELLATRQPAQYSAVATALLGLPLLLAGLGLLFGTRVPYIYPVVAGLLGGYLFTTGVHTYWRNTLTTYYVTTERIVMEYRFVSLVRNEIPFERVRGVEERRSVVDSLVGLGNVLVRSGGGSSLEVKVRHVVDAAELAELVRGQTTPSGG